MKQLTVKLNKDDLNRIYRLALDKVKNDTISSKLTGDSFVSKCWTEIVVDELNKKLEDKIKIEI